MAMVPTAKPVLELSSRDRSTLRWLYRQSTPYGKPLEHQSPSGHQSDHNRIHNPAGAP
jgi:hypothetical protein